MNDLAMDLSIGVYSVPEAARLTGVPPLRIRRWLRGYSYRHPTGERRAAPVWRGQWSPIEGQLALGFMDLIELRFVDAFLRAGVGWREMRLARAAASRKLCRDHPFCTGLFCTEGKSVLEDLARSEPALGRDAGFRDVVRGQRYFDRVMRPLIKELEFRKGGNVTHWWPLGPRRQVVLDPLRHFGQPIVAREGVPTKILVAALHANRSIAVVADWFEVQRQAVLDARTFEARFAA